MKFGDLIMKQTRGSTSAGSDHGSPSKHVMVWRHFSDDEVHRGGGLYGHSARHSVHGCWICWSQHTLSSKCQPAYIVSAAFTVVNSCSITASPETSRCYGSVALAEESLAATVTGIHNLLSNRQ